MEMCNLYRIIAYKGSEIAVIDAKDKDEADEKEKELVRSQWTIDGIFPL